MTVIKRDACCQIWATIEPTLPPHNRNFAKNIELLRKSKEDCQADADLWKRSGCETDSLDRDIDEVQPPGWGSDDEELLEGADESFNAETLIAAFHSISRSWNQEILNTAQHISALLCESPRPQCLQLQNLLPLNICNTGIYKSSGLKFFPSSTLHGNCA